MNCSCSGCEYKEQLKEMTLLMAHFDEQMEAYFETTKSIIDKLEIKT